MFTFLDFVFVAVVILSSVLAYNGGFVQESVSIAAWIGTVFLTKYIFPFVEPKFAGIFGSSSMFSAMAAYISVFVVLIMLLSFINKTFSTKLHKTNFGSIDKSLGFLFGFFRGILIMAVAYIIILWFMPNPNKRPNWVTDAKSKPILKVSSMFISSLLPSTSNFSEVKFIIKSDMSGTEIETFEKLSKPVVEGSFESSAENGYQPSEIKDLERQLQQLQQMEYDFNVKYETYLDIKKGL
ncbi:MAG: CvpA family protein [Alphaproteobacteria bacterium]|nr:CvpA family protein [Alphaproteobacteria bacterium]